MPEPLDDRLTRTISVPAWMVNLCVALLSVLAGGATLTVSFTVNHVFTLSQEQGEIKRVQAAQEVKQQDVVAAVNGLQKSLGEVSADVSEVSADVKTLQRMVESMP